MARYASFSAYWRAKRFAVELGRPFEGRTRAEIGEIPLPEIAFRGDDDTTMPLALMVAYERHGLDATSAQIASVWNRILPLTWFWRFRRWLLLGVRPPASGHRTEHGGEHIGAPILADLIGCLVPLRPERARVMAQRVGEIIGAGTGIEAGVLVADVSSRIAGGQSPRDAVMACEPTPGRAGAMLVGLRETAGEPWEWIVQFCADEDLRRTIPPSSLGVPEPWVRALPNLGVMLATWLGEPAEPLEAMRSAIRLGWDADTNAACVASPMAFHSGFEDLAVLDDVLPNPVRGLAGITVEEAASRCEALVEGG